MASSRRDRRPSKPSFEELRDLATELWNLSKEAEAEMQLYGADERPEAVAFCGRNAVVLSDLGLYVTQLNDAFRLNGISKFLLSTMSTELRTWLAETDKRYRPVYENQLAGEIEGKRRANGGVSPGDVRHAHSRPSQIRAALKEARRLLDGVVVLGELNLTAPSPVDQSTPAPYAMFAQLKKPVFVRDFCTSMSSLQVLKASSLYLDRGREPTAEGLAQFELMRVTRIHVDVDENGEPNARLMTDDPEDPRSWIVVTDVPRQIAWEIYRWAAQPVVVAAVTERQAADRIADGAAPGPPRVNVIAPRAWRSRLSGRETNAFDLNGAQFDFKAFRHQATKVLNVRTRNPKQTRQTLRHHSRSTAYCHRFATGAERALRVFPG